MSEAFALDPKLQADTVPLAESSLSLLRVFDDQRYPWLILIPKRAAVSEWFELEEREQHALAGEALRVGATLKQVYGATKINVGALGNVVRQLHVHVVGRREHDPAWPGPVWGHSQAVPYDELGVASVRSLLAASRLAQWFTFGP